MDIHAHQGDTITHVTTIDRGEKDDSPVFMISQARLERYWALEVALRALLADVSALLEEGSHDPDDIAGCSTQG